MSQWIGPLLQSLVVQVKFNQNRVPIKVGVANTLWVIYILVCNIPALCR